MEEYIEKAERLLCGWRSYIGRGDYRIEQVTSTKFTVERYSKSEFKIIFGLEHLGHMYESSCVVKVQDIGAGLTDWVPRPQEATKEMLIDIAKQLS